MNQLRIALLGQPNFHFNDKPLHESLLQKSQALQYYLAVEGETQPRDLLAGLLWSDMPQAKARVNLRTALARLRGEVGDFVTATRSHVTLNAGYWCDSADFQKHHTSTDLKTLQNTLALYRGDFLLGFNPPDAPLFEEWVILQRERLRQMMYDGTLRLVEMLGDSADFPAAIAQARRLIELDDLREVGHRKLIELLAQNGNRVAALTQFEQLRQLLSDELGVAPSAATLALVARMKQTPAFSAQMETAFSDATSRTENRNKRYNFPAIASSFHGRAREIAEIVETLEQGNCRLLTLVGMGGVGKTRLAIEAMRAEQLSTCWFVPLANVRSREGIVNTFVQTLDLKLSDKKSREEQLFTYLREKDGLFVLDNFEQLVGEARLLSELLQHCPQIKLLVTSRERLKLYEEWVVRLDGLPFELADNMAARLFEQRAQQQDRSFSLTAQHAAVGEICQRLEGLPLGIELAAAWTGMMSCREIVNELVQLETPYTNLPPRQRSLQAVFDYSWQLLSDAERDVLAKLTIFRGGFSADAAQKITTCTRQTLFALVEKSLVQRHGDRFDLHEMIRQFATPKLPTAVVDRLTTAFADYYLGWIAEREGMIVRGDDLMGLGQISAETDNLRSAWHHAASTNLAVALENAATAFGSYWVLHGWFEEGERLFALAQGEGLGRVRMWHSQFLARQGKTNETLPVIQSAVALLVDDAANYGYALTNLASAHQSLHQLDEASTHVAAAVAHFNARDDARGEGLALARQYLVESRRGNGKFALAAIDRALELLIHPRDRAYPLSYRAMSYIGAGDYMDALRLLQESETLHEQMGNLAGVASASLNAGVAAERMGDLILASQKSQRALDLFEQFGESGGIALAVTSLGEIARRQERWRVARAYHQRAMQINEQTNNQFGLILSRHFLGCVSSAENDPSALAQFQTVINMLLETQLGWLAVNLLPDVAREIARRGDAATALAIVEACLVNSMEATDRESAEKLRDELVTEGVRVATPLPQDPLQLTKLVHDYLAS